MAGRDVQAAGALLTADGTTSGYVTVLSSLPFRVEAHAWLSATGVLAREVIIASISTNGQIGVRYIDAPGTGANYGLSDASAYTVALGARLDMPAQLVDQDLISVDVVRQSAILEADVTPAFPAANDYLPVRLTDGTSFYTATGGGGGGGGTSSIYGSPFPSEGTAAGFTDGVDMQGATVFDEDTGPGTQFILGVSLRGPGLGGSVELGTGSNPIRVDPTGTTPQPVVFSTPPLVVHHNEITSVVSGVETTIISVTAGVTTHVSKVEVSGENVALFRVKVNGTIVSDKRSWWGAFNQTFDYPLTGLTLSVGDTLTVTVLHNRPTVANFETTVLSD